MPNFPHFRESPRPLRDELLKDHLYGRASLKKMQGMFP
jgi:hypothetical protein